MSGDTNVGSESDGVLRNFVRGGDLCDVYAFANTRLAQRHDRELKVRGRVSLI